MACEIVNQHKAFALHTSAKDQILQRIIELVLDSIHLLLCDSGIEDGLFAITMHEGQCPVGGNNAVVTGLQVLGGPKLIAALKGLALGHHDILRAPVFVGDSHIQFLSLALHIDMDNGLFNVSP